MTKALVRKQARELRKQNFSVKEIAEQLKVSKGTVSVWVRDVKNGRAEQARRSGCNLQRALEKVKANRIQRWEMYHVQAKEAWPSLSQNKDFMLGLGLYIGEGSKHSPGSTSISNCDPQVHLAFTRFLKIVGIEKDQLIFRVYAHNPTQEIEQWWSQVLSIPTNQIKIYQAQASKASKRVRKEQSFGTGDLKVRNGTELRQKLEVWMKLALEGS